MFSKKIKRNAFVSGVSSEIGKNLAISLRKRGFTVYGSCDARYIWETKELQDVYGIKVLSCDVSKVKEIQELAVHLEPILSKTGGLHLLYNNEGVVHGGPAIEIPDGDLEQIFKVNVLGNILVTKYLSNLIIQAKGIVVFSSSATGKSPIPWLGAYGSSKAAIDQYALVLRNELRPFGVRVHSVIAGIVRNDVNYSGISTDCVRGQYYAVDGIYDSFKSLAHSDHIGISSKEFAEETLDKILNPWFSPGFNIFEGSRAYLSQVAHSYLPLWILEYSIAFRFKLLRVWAEIRKNNKRNARNATAANERSRLLED